MCKSAQIFFHIWLPDAMEGPTPVSALIHAATMVTAGVFLIIKCSILFEYTPRMLAVLVVVGALTSLLGATASLFQHDVKKVIAYSTCSQLGYMVVACGISRYDIAFFHLVNHAFFKAVLFLGAGVIIHSLAGEQDMRRMGGLKNKLLAVYALMLIASFALAGVPYLSGFYSKDLILGFSYSLGERVGFFGYLMCILAAIFTSLYSAKLLHLVFYVSPKGIRKTYSDLHSPGGFALLPIFILGIASIFSGFYLKDLMVGVGSNFFDGLIFISAQKDFVMDVEYIDSIFFKLLPFFVGISGFVYYFLKRAQIFKA
jgi:NADH-ubiquinone oxidoreductase chain 5